MVRLKKKNLVEDEKQIVSLNPKKLVSHFYDKVDLLTAGIVIFSAIFLESLIFLILKMPRVLEYFTINILISFIFSWFILGFILYLILYLFKGKSNLKGGEYKQILSGLASFRVVSIFSTLFVFLILLIFLPNVIPKISIMFSNPAFLLNSGFLPSIGVAGIIGIILLIIFGIALAIYYILMIYHFVKKMYNFKNLFSNILMTVVILLIMGVIASII